MTIEVDKMDNLHIWNEKRTVPAEYLKTIGGGRLRGMSDISPQWRLQALTEMFGPVGIGWRYETVERWTDAGGDAGEISAHVRINMFVKVAGEWSGAIEGQGGSMLVEREKGGLHMSDECWKMATTDAISVACKQLGLAADVYLGKMESKYSRPSAPIADLSGPLKDIEGATSLDDLKERWMRVYNAHIGDSASLGILTAAKDKVKLTLQVSGVFDGKVQE
jgi:hypothetical protein